MNLFYISLYINGFFVCLISFKITGIELFLSNWIFFYSKFDYVSCVCSHSPAQSVTHGRNLYYILTFNLSLVQRVAVFSFYLRFSIYSCLSDQLSYFLICQLPCSYGQFVLVLAERIFFKFIFHDNSYVEATEQWLIPYHMYVQEVTHNVIWDNTSWTSSLFVLNK